MNNPNINVQISEMVEDGRWEDEQWVTEQAALSAAQNLYEHGQEQG